MSKPRFRFHATLRVPLADRMVSTRDLGVCEVTMKHEARGVREIEIRPENGEVRLARYYPLDERSGLDMQLTPERIELRCDTIVDNRQRLGTLILTPVQT